MSEHKYDRSITLYCPTCGGTDFSDAGGIVTCASCNLQITRDDLVRANDENIQAHVAEVQREVAKDLKKRLADALRGSKHIKIR